MDGPASAVNAHTMSASSKRLSQRGIPRGNVSRTPVEMLAPFRSSHTSISGRGSIATNDLEWPTTRTLSEPLEDREELWRRADELACAAVFELRPAEVR